MFKNKYYIDKIIFNFSVLSTELQIKNKIKLSDDNIFSENLFCHILNIIYDLNLSNINAESINYPAIDLRDINNKIAFQITTTNTKQKINKTLDKFLNNTKHLFFNNYNRLVILILTTESLKYTDNEINKSIFKFIPLRDIKNLNDIIEDIKNLDINKIKKLNSLLENELQQIDVTFDFNKYILKSPKNATKFNKFIDRLKDINFSQNDNFNKNTLLEKLYNLNGQYLEKNIQQEQLSFIQTYEILDFDYSIYFIDKCSNIYLENEFQSKIKEVLKIRILDEINYIKKNSYENESEIPNYLQKILTGAENKLNN